LVLFASMAWSAGLAELVFSSSPWIGLGVLIALALFDWRAAGLAALAACGTLTAFGIGFPPSLISIGLYGFGPALTALALRRGTVRCGWLATVVAASATAIATAILGTLGSNLSGVGMCPRAAGARIRSGRGKTTPADRDEHPPVTAQLLVSIGTGLLSRDFRCQPQHRTEGALGGVR
jgi:hypothetical protein